MRMDRPDWKGLARCALAESHTGRLLSTSDVHDMYASFTVYSRFLLSALLLHDIFIARVGYCAFVYRILHGSRWFSQCKFDLKMEGDNGR
ncbi:hypothetical protein DENSPDRAFT_313437 [Dentipellis sp. KUC8613]|nr:hypothetical protein DENSPDRAFT_313437 [Dentipellis sp. KUC8613]